MGLVDFARSGPALDLHNPAGIYLEVTKGFRMPFAVRGSDYTIASAAGRVRGNRIEDVLVLMLEGYVAGTDAEDWAANRDALLAILAEGEGIDPGMLTVRAPLYGLAVGESCAIVASVASIVEGPITAYQRQTFSVALECVDGVGWVLDSGS